MEMSMLSLCHVDLVQLLHVYRYFFLLWSLTLVFPIYWVLTESRIKLKLVLGGVRIVVLSISSHKQTQ